MYWPIAAPRVYVARVPPPAVPIDYDSEGSAELVRHRLSVSSAADDPDQNDSVKGSTEDEDEGRKVGEKEVEDEESLPDTPSASSRGNQHQNSTNSSPNEELSHIIALRVARNGHLFATVTKTELTIWQTKVRILRWVESSS